MAKIIVLVGIPGVGKTTYGRSLIESSPNKEKMVLLSADDIRAEIYGSADIVGDPGRVFNIMHQRKKKFLEDGIDVIFDATSLTRKGRRCAFANIPEGTEKEIHIVWAPVQLCIDRDSKRMRTVGSEGIWRRAKEYQPPYYDECENIKLVVNCEHDYKNYRAHCIEALFIPHDNPHHTFDVYQHSRAAADYAKDHGMNDEIWRAALYHDIGKPDTKFMRYNPTEKRKVGTYYQHDQLGGWMAYGISPYNPLLLSWLIGNHMHPYYNSTYYNEMGPELKGMLDQLHECDVNAH